MCMCICVSMLYLCVSAFVYISISCAAGRLIYQHVCVYMCQHTIGMCVSIRTRVEKVHIIMWVPIRIGSQCMCDTHTHAHARTHTHTHTPIFVWDLILLWSFFMDACRRCSICFRHTKLFLVFNKLKFFFYGRVPALPCLSGKLKRPTSPAKACHTTKKSTSDYFLLLLYF